MGMFRLGKVKKFSKTKTAKLKSSQLKRVTKFYPQLVIQICFEVCQFEIDARTALT